MFTKHKHKPSVSNINYLKDVLHKASIEVATCKYTIVYGRGVLVGVVATTMAVTDCPFSEAVKIVCETYNLAAQENPHNQLNQHCLPEWKDWQNEFNKHLVYPQE